MFDIVARKFGDLVHHIIHTRDDLLQELRLLADDILRDIVRERQNVLQPLQKTRWHLIVLVLYLQELYGQALPPLAIRQWRARTSTTAFAIGVN